MATVPTLPTFLSGEKVLASKLNAATKTPFEFLLNPPRVCAYATADATPNTGQWSIVSMAGEAWDTDAMHNPSTDNSRITINTPGQYLVTIYARWAANATGFRSLNLRINSAGSATNGSTITTIASSPASTTNTFVTRTMELTCNKGDHYELFTYQNSGGTLAVQSGYGVTGMEFRWVGVS
ncbi:hypothetical protein ACWDTQ_26615 [Streptomyces cellulosae]